MTQSEIEELAKTLCDIAVERGAEGVVVAVMTPDEWCGMHEVGFRRYGFWFRTKQEGMLHWIRFLVARLALSFGVPTVGAARGLVVVDVTPQSTRTSDGKPGGGGCGGVESCGVGS